MSGIRTNAVAFGRKRAFVAGLAVFTAAYVYLVMLAATGLVARGLMFLGVLCPLHFYWSFRAKAGGLTFRSISRLRARYHALYAIIGVSMMAALLFGRP